MSPPVPRLVTNQSHTERLHRQHQTALGALQKKLTAADETIASLTAQLQRTEQILERLVAAKTTTAAQRRELLGLLAGTRVLASITSVAPNSVTEQHLVDAYRAMPTNDRQLIGRLVNRLATARRRRPTKGGA
jgi:hypothetical protein